MLRHRAGPVEIHEVKVIAHHQSGERLDERQQVMLDGWVETNRQIDVAGMQVGQRTAELH